MENERNETKIIILCVLAAICVVTISIIVLVGIWTDNDEEEADKVQVASTSLGTFQNMQVSMDEQVAKYSENIIAFLTTKNIDKIYNMTNPEYLEYFKLDKAGLKKVLENKGFYGTVLTTDEYNSTTVDSNNCFRVSLSSSNNDYVDGTVNIIEYSPNDYKISFDRFIFYKKEPIKYIREDLVITVSEQVAYDSMYNVTISITNNTDDTVYLNNKEAYEFIYLVNTAGNEIGTSTHLYAGQSVSILKNKTINMNLGFSLKDMAIGTIKSIKIKDVETSKTGITTDIELDI